MGGLKERRKPEYPETRFPCHKTSGVVSFCDLKTGSNQDTNTKRIWVQTHDCVCNSRRLCRLRYQRVLPLEILLASMKVKFNLRPTISVFLLPLKMFLASVN